MTSPIRLQNDLLAYLHSQLPAKVADKVREVRVTTDPFHIRTLAVFIDQRGRKHECVLESEDINGVALACKIPEVFLAKLCVMV